MKIRYQNLEYLLFLSINQIEVYFHLRIADKRESLVLYLLDIENSD